MGLRVVGAGLPRTGTLSLKGALEQLLGGPCYHMSELFAHPEHADTWREAVDGTLPNWDSFLRDYRAAVDWPASKLWRELSSAYPDALVLLSVRDSPEDWWRSMDQTIFARIREARRAMEGGGEPPLGEHPAVGRMLGRIAIDGMIDAVDDKDATIAWYERHLAEVRSAVPVHRLLEWKASDGWQPLCEALDVPVPDESFPHVNSTGYFTENFGDAGRRSNQNAR